MINTEDRPLGEIVRQKDTSRLYIWTQSSIIKLWASGDVGRFERDLPGRLWARFSLYGGTNELVKGKVAATYIGDFLPGEVEIPSPEELSMSGMLYPNIWVEYQRLIDIHRNQKLSGEFA